MERKVCVAAISVQHTPFFWIVRNKIIQLARAYAYRFVGDEVLQLYNQTMKGIDKGEVGHVVMFFFQSTIPISNIVSQTGARVWIEQC